MGVALEPVGREDYLTAISLQRQNGFTTNDALMIACAERLRVQAIASADRNLASARGIILYSPDDAEE
jgi:predicted nucleic acid-binding protein